MKRPAFQFYPGDWLRSTDLRSCSVGARGLWIDMLCLMHDGNPYGYLKVKDKVILPVNLASMVGETLDQTAIWLQELENSGVFSRKNECIFSRRMVRDEKVRESRAKGGALGGNPALMNGHKVNLTANLGITPASAVAVASASAKQKPKAEKHPFVIPEDIDTDLWQDFLGMRRSIRKPATDRAQWLILGKLRNMEKEGQDVAAMLRQSIRNSWQDVFPVKTERVK